MSKYDFIFDMVKPEIMQMEKDELDSFRKYLLACNIGKYWPEDSMPFYECRKEEKNYIIQFSKKDRNLEKAIYLLGEDRLKAFREKENGETRRTAIEQIENYLETWVRERYFILRSSH